MDAKRALVRHIGHEIRTPLNIVGVGAEVLSKELKSLGDRVPPVLLELVEGIEEASTAALEVCSFHTLTRPLSSPYLIHLRAALEVRVACGG